MTKQYSEEEKAKQREYNKIHAESRSEEEREKHNAKNRKYYHTKLKARREADPDFYKKVYAKLTPEQKKKKNEHKSKKYAEDPEYRKQIKEATKKHQKKIKEWLATQTPEVQKEYLAKKRNKSKGWTRKLQKQLEETNDPKYFFKAKLRKIKDNAKNRGLEATITIDECLKLYETQKGLCHYTGEKLVLKAFIGKTNNRQNFDEFKNFCTLDRIDNLKGYVSGNIVLSTYKVNIARGQLTYDEFLKICQFIESKERNIKK